jgi:ribosomal protein S18 acetylase RimI-like enzyme
VPDPADGAAERWAPPEEGVRLAGPDDVPAIVDLAGDMAAELTSLRGGALWAVREARSAPLEASYRSLIGRPDARLVVGTLDGVVIGFGAGEVEALRDGSRLGVITDLFVHPDAREVGVGEAMLGDLVGFFTGCGCAGVDAFALPGHRATKNFFEEGGFTARAILMHHRLSTDEPEAE